MEHARRVAIVDAPGQFPDPRHGPPDFPVAVGWTLSAELMLEAYGRGIFAWSDDPVTWWSPDPRAIFELDRFHVSRSLARALRRGRFGVTVDAAFGEVVRGCASPRAHDAETWITPRFAACFERLRRGGHAHSVECWLDGALVGGVFGVALGGLFSAESMFHTASDASKVALFHLVGALRAAGYALLDIQILTPHTESLGAVEISRDEYLDRLAAAVALRPLPLTRVP